MPYGLMLLHRGGASGPLYSARQLSFPFPSWILLLSVLSCYVSLQMTMVPQCNPILMMPTTSKVGACQFRCFVSRLLSRSDITKICKDCIRQALVQLEQIPNQISVSALTAERLPA